MIQSLHGLRGWASLIVFLNHLIVPIFPVFYTQTASSAHGPVDLAWAKSIGYVLFNDLFALILFFTLSGLVLSISYFTTWDKTTVWCSAAKRYFRLTLPVIPVLFLTYLLQKHALFNHLQMSLLGGHAMLQSQLNFTPDWLPMLSATLLYKTGLMQYNEPVWTLRNLLTGSFFVYAILLVCGQSKLRLFVYLMILLYWWNIPVKCFIIGMLITDLTCNAQSTATFPGSFRPLFFMLLFLLGLVLGSHPDVFIEPSHSQTLLRQWGELFRFDRAEYHYLFAACAVILSVLHSQPLSAFFSNRLSTFLGRIAFSLYLLHWPLEASGGFRIFITSLENQWSYQTSFAIYLAITAPAILWLAYLYAVFVEIPMTRKLKTLCDRVAQRMKRVAPNPS